MEKEIPIKPIKPEFLDFINYNICKAYSETHGKEAAEAFFRKVGRIGFQELMRRIEFPSREPYEVLRRVADFLEEMGYLAKIKLTKVMEDEVIIEMFGVSVVNSSMRLVREGASPSHFMTNLMFAALEGLCGLRADIIDLTLEQPTAETGYAKEKWILKKI